ncbi:hypothetical protein G3R49_13755 [Shewanella sp. WXL01]|uniref:hypothetical protein n=1 Tax=Shewanella sp. WXL01 TaxID=2709721 RepID=UPI001438482E|nr:hypothetical protein [Shewanella sp. WXL01]NKF51625.1 hypothetical protein [Shewanella sp. WXL01]
MQKVKDTIQGIVGLIIMVLVFKSCSSSNEPEHVTESTAPITIEQVNRVANRSPKANLSALLSEHPKLDLLEVPFFDDSIDFCTKDVWNKDDWDADDGLTNAEYTQLVETINGMINRIEEEIARVKALPASDHSGNYQGYEYLSCMYPENQIYKDKLNHYKGLFYGQKNVEDNCWALSFMYGQDKVDDRWTYKLNNGGYEHHILFFDTNQRVKELVCMANMYGEVQSHHFDGER